MMFLKLKSYLREKCAFRYGKAMRDKIPCYIVTFFMFENFKRCIECFLKKSEYLDIKIIENYSKYTEEKFKPYIMDLLDKKLVSEYFLFEENISNNAIKEILYAIEYDKIQSPFFMISDSDLLFSNDWLEEEIQVLLENPEVYAVGMELTLKNLPPNIKGAENWVPKAIKEKGLQYSIGFTGTWALLFRTKELSATINYLKDNNLTFVDSSFHEYCNLHGKKWARTIQNIAYHLTWDNYSNPNDEYALWKSKYSLQEIWNHNRTCKHSVFKSS